MYPKVILKAPSPLKSVKVLQNYAGPGNPSPVQAASAELENKISDLHSACSCLTHAAARINNLYEKELTTYSAQLVRLSVDIARKILHNEISSGNYNIETIILEAIKNIPARENVSIRLNPADAQTVTEQASGFGFDLKVVSDSSVGRGECVIESPGATLESHIENHLEFIEQALVGAHG
jgi:flagellar assembly protein FliH